MQTNGWFPLDRAWLEIKGADSRKFLNGLLTNNIQTLKTPNGCHACICTAKGKMIVELYCYACHSQSDGDYFGIDCDAVMKQAVLENLKKYIIFQKVVVEDKSDKWSSFVVLGELPPNIKQEEGLWIIPKRIWKLDSSEIWVKKEKENELKSKLNLKELSKEEQEVLRIESATPKWGVDMDENTFPQEANLYDALSFNKGCYVGQEIVARLEHRGHVGKQLRLLKLEGADVPQRGEKILNESGEEVGNITSSCYSPKYKSPIALGIIRYNFLNATALKVGNEAAVLIHQTHNHG